MGRRLLAWCAIFAFTGTFGFGAGTLGHSGVDDDAACRGAITAGHPITQIGAAAKTTPASHCPFCHWQRAVSGASILAADLGASPLLAVDLATSVTTHAPGVSAISLQPSRAPPAPIV